MQYFWITLLVLITSGCARTEYAATPNPEEVSTITYQQNNGQLRQTWLFVNNDLTLRYTKQDSSGRLVDSRFRKLSPNDFNWIVTQFENANYTKIRSPSKVENSGYIGRQIRSIDAPEVVSIETLGGTYRFQRKGNINFPPAIEAITKKIPTLY